MRKAAIALAFLSIIAPAVFAQQHPNQKKGFNANNVYQFNGLDTINAFNGNLTMSIPIGPSFSVGGGLSYGLTLYSNANLWEGESHCHEVTPGVCTMVCPRFNKDCDPWERVDPTFMYPHRRANAGLGWTLSFGRLYQPEHPTMPNQGLWTYESPDGADHVFEGLGGVLTTVDGSYLRLKGLADDPFTTEVGDPVNVVEFPDGTIQVFQPPSATTTDYWGLRRITNRFSQNYLKISYGRVPDPNNPNVDHPDFPNGLRWSLEDSHGRKHWIDFKRIAYDGEMRLLVKQVHLSRNGTDTPATVVFNYLENQTLSRGEFQSCTFHHPSPPGQPETQWQTAKVPLLSSVDLPDGLGYGFTYRISSSAITFQAGVPFTMTLPTGGMIEWEWGPYYKPAASVESSEEFYRVSYGVYKRKLWGRLNAGGTRDLVGTWDYQPGLDFEPNHSCDPNPVVPIPPGFCVEFTNTITPPAVAGQASKTVHYFSVATAPIPPWSEFEYGLPFTKNVSDGSSQPRWLSTQLLGPTGSVLRSTFVRYVEDFPYRMVSKRVRFDDDQGLFNDSDSSDYAGFGNYRTQVTSSSFPNTPTRTSFTNYQTITSADINNPAFPWIIGLYDHMTVSEGGKTLRTDYCFDSNTGFMKQKRIRKEAASAGANDLLAVFEPDARGNVRWERYYGGDILPTANRVGSVRPAASVGTGAICSAVTGTMVYELGHTRVEPTATTDGSVVSKYTGVDVNVSDVTIDRRTGLVSKSRDTAGVETLFEYDWMGRPVWEKPTGRASTKYEFITPSSLEIKVSKFGANLVTPLLETKYRIDALGRVDRETTKMPNGVETERNTVYDALGRQTSVSEPGQPTALTSFSYDALGRVVSVTLPDSSTTTTTYVGDRQKTRTSGIRTSTSSTDVAVPVVEKYDGFGRLIAVTEKSGPTTAAAPIGALVTTEYQYDLADRLTTVTMNKSASPVQHRFFDYDGRGFLRWESQPEAGVTSYLYDARGNLVTKRQAGNPGIDLDYFYDQAERQTRIESANPHFEPNDPERPPFRPIKEFQFGTANEALGGGVTNLAKGKLVNAIRYNYHSQWDWWSGYKVTHRYRYLDTAGRRVSRITTIADLFDFELKSIDFGTDYNELDLPTTMWYPMCDGCGFAPNIARNNEVLTYDRGRLSSLAGFLSSVTYWPNGMRNVMAHANGIADTQVVGTMPRPASIAFGTYNRCVKPKFTTQPSGTSVSTSGEATLWATATGTATIKYDWYDEVGHLVGTTSTITVHPTATTEYVVVATNDCGETYSNTVKVTVTSCTPPEITSITPVVQPDRSWILTPAVIVRTQSLSYEWKRLPDNTPMGTGETLSVGLLSATTTFSLKVSDVCGDTTANVTINVAPAMTAVTATANAARTQITLAWPAVAGATSYSVDRRWGADWEQVGTPTSAGYTDASLVSGRVYAYRVRALGSFGATGYSNTDVASTASLTPVVAGQITTSGGADTMLAAVNLVRTTAGWPAVTWATILSPSDPVVAIGNLITARQLLACRARMNEALLALGSKGVLYTDPDAVSSGVRALHVMEIQGAVE